MNIAAILLTLIAGIFMYVTINVATIVSWIGLAAVVIFIILEMARTYSTETDYIWNENKSFSIVYGSSFVIFAMTTCVLTMKYLA